MRSVVIVIMLSPRQGNGTVGIAREIFADQLFSVRIVEPLKTSVRFWMDHSKS
jgi:hypothetical protein